MADIKLRIEVNPNAETETLGTITNEINDVGSNSNLSNASFKANSNGVYIDTSNPKESGREMLSWANNGQLKFTSDGYLSTDGIKRGFLVSEQEPDMFVWGAVPESKQYSVKLTFSNANALKDIIIYGDITANQFPTKAIVDGVKTIYSNDPYWAINMDTESDTHTIEFLEWNRANYNACFTKIMVMLKYIDLEKGAVDNIESLSQNYNDSINYGILANSGSSKIRDLNGELKDYIQDGIIPLANEPLSIYINGKQNQSHITSNTDYSNSDKILNIQLTNNLSLLDAKMYGGRELTANCRLRKLFYEILTELGYSGEVIQNMFSKIIVFGDNSKTGSVWEYLNEISIEYPYLKNGSYREILDKLCTIAQIKGYEDNVGNLTFVTARPIADISEKSKAIKIPKAFQISELKYDVILKNKYDGIDTVEYITRLEYKELSNSNVKLNINETPSTNRYIRNFSINSYSGDITQISTYEGFNTDVPSIYMQQPNKLGGGVRVKIKIDLANTSEYFIKSSLGSRSYKIDCAINKNDYAVLYTQSFFSDKLSETASSTAANTELVYSKLGIFARVDNISYSDNSFVYDIYVQAMATCGAFSGDIDAKWTDYVATDFNLSIKYPCITTTENIIKTNSPAQIQSNELLANTTTYNDVPIATIINNNIKQDYAKGVATATIDLFCGDLFYSNETKAKDWSLGEMLDIDDIIYFENDLYQDKTQRYWRITGRNFKYAGSPTVSLELQEIIKFYDIEQQ